MSSSISTSVLASRSKMSDTEGDIHAHDDLIDRDLAVAVAIADAHLARGQHGH
jgi:hypothetical protein